MKMNMIVLNLSLLLAMCSCSQEIITDVATITNDTGTRLIAEKRKLSDGTEHIIHSYQYNEVGQLVSEVGQRVDQSFVTSKMEYFYNDEGMVIRSTSMLDFSSDYLKPLYSYGSSTYEYDAQGRMIRQNAFLKKESDEEPRSYLLYEYNASNLLIKHSQFSLTDELIRYSTYFYEAGNVVRTSEYEMMDNATALTLAHESTFEYDDKRNPYKEMYKGILLNARWMSSNNLKKSVSTHYVYASNPKGDRTTSSTNYKQYNADRFPVSISEGNGSELIFVYE